MINKILEEATLYESKHNKKLDQLIITPEEKNKLDEELFEKGKKLSQIINIKIIVK